MYCASTLGNGRCGRPFCKIPRKANTPIKTAGKGLGAVVTFTQLAGVAGHYLLRRLL